MLDKLKSEANELRKTHWDHLFNHLLDTTLLHMKSKYIEILL